MLLQEGDRAKGDSVQLRPPSPHRVLADSRRHGVQRMFPWASPPAAAFNLQAVKQPRSENSTCPTQALTLFLQETPHCPPAMRGTKLQAGRSGGGAGPVGGFQAGNCNALFCLPGRSFPIIIPYFGGGGRTRTCDLRVMSPSSYQLLHPAPRHTTSTVSTLSSVFMRKTEPTQGRRAPEGNKAGGRRVVFSISRSKVPGVPRPIGGRSRTGLNPRRI